MLKKTYILIGVTLGIFPLAVFAQQSAEKELTVQELSAASVKKAGDFSCFDYYKPGSVQIDIQPSLGQSVPGATLEFSGSLKNANSYPVANGTLFIRVFHKESGNTLVDQSAVAKQVYLGSQEEKPISFTWKIPTNARGGSYAVSYFFTTEGYGLQGNPFGSDGSDAKSYFTVQNTADVKMVTVNKDEVTFNGKKVASPLTPARFSKDEAVVMGVKLVNTSDVAKNVPLQWNQYIWDASREENRVTTKTELVSVSPGETKEVSFTTVASKAAVTYVTVQTQDGEAKSFANGYFVRDGIEEVRTSFLGLSSFPVKKDQEQTMFSCAHATNVPVAKDNVLLLTLKDKNDAVITEYQYQGEIYGRVAGFGKKFTPTKDYDYVKLEATLIQGGSEVEKITSVYDCAQANPGSCSNENDKKGGFLSQWQGGILVAALAAVVALALVFLFRRKSKKVQW